MTFTFKCTTVDENEIKYKDFKIEEFIRSQIELQFPILGPEQIYKKLVESGCDEEKACDMVEKIQIDNEEKRQKKIKKKLEKLEILKSSCDPTNLKIVPTTTNVNNNNNNINNSDFGGNNSFVYSAWLAYNNHAHLVIRPDNIWCQIVTQFSIYINKNSKYFKDKIFDFDHHHHDGAGNGKHNKEHHHHHHHHNHKGLIHISTNYPILEAPYEKLVGDLANQISLNIKDSTIRDWIIPNFTTTTPSDKVVYSAALMSTMKENLVYKVLSTCGLPKVTLNGVPEDWINLRERVLKLREYDIVAGGDTSNSSSTGSLGSIGGQMSTWVNLLLPIMNKFVETSQGKPDIDWWNQIVDHRSRPSGNGSCVLSGWLSVFCIFKNDGTFRGEHQHTSSNGNNNNGDLSRKGSSMELSGKKKGSNLDISTSRKNSGIDLGGKNNNNNNNNSGNNSNNGSSGNLDPNKGNSNSLNNLATPFSLKSSTGSLGNGSTGSLGGGNNWPRISDSSIANGFGSCPLILTNSDGTKFHSEIYFGHLGVTVNDRTKISPSLDWLILIDNELHEKSKCVIN